MILRRPLASGLWVMRRLGSKARPRVAAIGGADRRGRPMLEMA